MDRLLSQAFGNPALAGIAIGCGCQRRNRPQLQVRAVSPRRSLAHGHLSVLSFQERTAFQDANLSGRGEP